eukprot:1302529-Karenia_brevis.AAC.1
MSPGCASKAGQGAMYCQQHGAMKPDRRMTDTPSGHEARQGQHMALPKTLATKPQGHCVMQCHRA